MRPKSPFLDRFSAFAAHGGLRHHFLFGFAPRVGFTKRDCGVQSVFCQRFLARGLTSTCAIFAFWRDGRFFGCDRSFSRGAKTSAVFLDRVGYLDEESDGVSLLFLFSQIAGGVSA